MAGSAFSSPRKPPHQMSGVAPPPAVDVFFLTRAVQVRVAQRHTDGVVGELVDVGSADASARTVRSGDLRADSVDSPRTLTLT